MRITDDVNDKNRSILNRSVYVHDVRQAAGLERERLVGRDLMIARIFGGTVRIADAGEVVAQVERMSATALEALQRELARLYAQGPYGEPFPRFGVAGEGSSDEPMTFLERLFGRGSAGGADPRNLRRA